MPEEFLLLEPVKLDIRGFESRRALQNVSPAVWKICPSGRKRTVHEIVCENVFILTFVIIHAKAAAENLSASCTVRKEIFWHCLG